MWLFDSTYQRWYNNLHRAPPAPLLLIDLTYTRTLPHSLPRTSQSSRDAARNPTDAPDAQHVTGGREGDGEMDEGERELQNMRETSGLMYDDMVSEFLGGDRSRPQPTAADRRCRRVREFVRPSVYPPNSPAA